MRVVVLNGPPGAGKTTIGRLLAATARNGVCIHGDDLKHFVVAREPGTVTQGLSYVGGAALADIYLAAGYELVVFEFVFECRANVEQFLGSLRSGSNVDLFTLWAPLEILEAREATREHRERLGERVRTSWQRMAANIGDLGEIIDATGTVEDVLAALRLRLPIRA